MLIAHTTTTTIAAAATPPPTRLPTEQPTDQHATTITVNQAAQAQQHTTYASNTANTNLHYRGRHRHRPLPSASHLHPTIVKAPTRAGTPPYLERVNLIIYCQLLLCTCTSYSEKTLIVNMIIPFILINKG